MKILLIFMTTLLPLFTSDRPIASPHLRSIKVKFSNQVNYCPSPSQAQVHYSCARHRIVAAGARFGKSMLAGFEAAFYFAFYSDFRIWMVATQYELADKEFFWAYDFLCRFRCPNGQRLVEACQVKTAGIGPHHIRAPWGSYIITKSTTKPESLLGEPVNLMILSEASYVSTSVYQHQLRARLGDRAGRLLEISTPNSDAGLFSKHYALGRDETQKDWESWLFNVLENPTFSKIEYETAKQELPADVFAEQYMGKFVSRRGRVFAEFGTRHIFKDFPKDFETLPVFRGIQPGFTNAFVCLWTALDASTRTYYVFNEYFEYEKIIEDAIKEIRPQVPGRRYMASVSDLWKEVELDTMKSQGLFCRCNEVEKKLGRKMASIRRVQALQAIFKVQEDGTTRIKIHVSCINLIKELQECKWPDRQKEAAEKAELETPLTKYFQAPQALSHVVSFCEQGWGNNIYRFQASKKEQQA